MHPRTLQIAGSRFVRSTIFISAVLAVSSLPSVAAPVFSESTNPTVSQDDIVYGQVPRQLVVSQKPAATNTAVLAPLTIGRIGSNGLPNSIAINYSSKPLSVGGGGTPTRTLPQFAFIPQNSLNQGGEINAPVRSSRFETHVIQSDQGFLDESTQTQVRFSF
ncbi:hypothetical protein LEP3755_03820 [Leptolyngbya sp. NIES-3755]|nr:hypothetical protein LEP3755_03820 [Leptolyngbya sp. NIES-3755]